MTRVVSPCSGTAVYLSCSISILRSPRSQPFAHRYSHQKMVMGARYASDVGGERLTYLC